MESWLSTQAEHTVATWEKTVERFYPQYLEAWTNPDAHFRALMQERNSLEAVEYLNWDAYLVGNPLRVLDIGAGAGWLSLWLSARANIAQIYALDSSPTNLQTLLPGLAPLLRSDLTKIKPVLGLFTPLLVDADFFDVVVACAALHHAPDLAECLAEIYRALKPGGYLLILNELPVSSMFFALATLNRCRRILIALTLRRWQPITKPISENMLMLDPVLGDRAYCAWQWQAALRVAGFTVETILTPFYPYKKSATAQTIRLTHFIAQKARH